MFFPSQYLLRGFYGSLLRECHGDWMHPFVYKKYISIKEIWGEACSAIMETFYCAQFVHIISQCMLMVQSPTQIFFRKNDGTLQFEIKIEYVD